MKVHIGSVCAHLVIGLMVFSVSATARQRTYRYIAKDFWRTKPGTERHSSPDHRLQAIVRYVKPRKEGLQASSIVEIRTDHGQELGHADYRWSDTVTGAAWTADAQYFVYMTESPAGHSPWTHYVRFYSRRRHKFYYLDKALRHHLSSHGLKAGIGTITGDLELYKPCTLKTKGMVNISIPGVRVRLLKHSDSFPLDNALTIDLGRLERSLTQEDEEYKKVTDPRTVHHAPEQQLRAAGPYFNRNDLDNPQRLPYWPRQLRRPRHDLPHH